VCAWQLREQPQVLGHERRPDVHTPLVRPSSTILVGRISPGPGACTSCPSCLHELCTCEPCLRLCVCQPASVGRYHVPARACDACAGLLCTNALHLFARAFPVPARVLCLHFVDTLNCGEFTNPIDSCNSSG